MPLKILLAIAGLSGIFLVYKFSNNFLLTVAFSGLLVALAAGLYLYRATYHTIEEMYC